MCIRLLKFKLKIIKTNKSSKNRAKMTDLYRDRRQMCTYNQLKDQLTVIISDDMTITK